MPSDARTALDTWGFLALLRGGLAGYRKPPTEHQKDPELELPEEANKESVSPGREKKVTTMLPFQDGLSPRIIIPSVKQSIAASLEVLSTLLPFIRFIN